ncbi:MAG TPA: hypothetical protein VFV47_02155 [Hyphomicrobiaceae bacterium]|jgi:hypothetical protein|nr:hypothetical protein [Hyphomicrobiaceae bacterium]
MRIAAALIFALSLSESVYAQERSEGMGFPVASDSARYSFAATPAEPGAPAMLWHQAAGSLVLVKRASDTWSISGRAGELELSRSPVIPQTGLVVPSKLWEFQASGAFSRRLGDRRAWGFSAGMGSASDEPFRTIHETEARATAYREFPSRERNSWMLFLAYSNNRSFLNNVPFPGVAYVFREPVPGLKAAVGLPFVSLSYQPGKNWSGNLSAFGPANLSAEGARRLCSEAWLYARYERNPSQWLRAGRTERSDRLIFDQHEARLGVRSPSWNGLSMDLSIGRAFRRRFFESRDASRSNVPKAELADAWVGALRILFKGR